MEFYDNQFIRSKEYANKFSNNITKLGYLSPFENFAHALKSKDVQRQYLSILNRFLNFQNSKDMEQICIQILQMARKLLFLH